MHPNKYPVTSRDKWPSDPHARWIRVGNNFGAHLMAGVRDDAVAMLAKRGVSEAQARETVELTLASLMAFFDGVIGYCDIDDLHYMSYVLQAQVVERTTHKAIETFELAPDGDGLGMGLAGWLQGDFGKYHDTNAEE